MSEHRSFPESAEELVVQAVLYNYFPTPQSTTKTFIVNMSFEFDSPSLRGNADAIFFNSHSVGVIAVSNDDPEATAALFPQGFANIYPNLVNVTYGLPDGTVLGPVSATFSNTPVHLVAPGCGFEGAVIRAADFGTSFASPYVATAAWLHALLHRSESTDRLKQEMIAASRPSRATIGLVMSEGIFDSALLLSSPPFRYVDKLGKAVSLQSVKGCNPSSTNGQITFQNKPFLPITLPIGGQPDASTQWVAVFFNDDNAQPNVWLRDLTGRGSFVGPGPHLLLDADLDLLAADGSEVRVCSKDQVMDAIREFWAVHQ